MPPFEIISAGYAAYPTLVTPDEASVWGNTSRGLFIVSQDGQILFLTAEMGHGPLTVHLNHPDNRLKSVATKSIVLLSPDELSIPSAYITYPINNPAIWKSDLPAETIVDHTTLWKRLVPINKALIQEKPARGLVDLLPVGSPNKNGVAVQQKTMGIIPKFTRASSTLSQAISTKSPNAMADCLAGLLGAGAGLTPSGDDFTVGVVLTINRWKYPSWIEQERQDFNQRIIESAKTKTTSLSACLIQCATEGQADERLLNAIDFIFTGQGDPAEQVQKILDWGSSSGIDTMAGISTVILACM